MPRIPAVHMKLLLSDKLQFPANPNLVAHQYATGFERRIPGESKIFSVYHTLNSEPCLFTAPRILADPAKLDVQIDFFAYSFNRKYSLKLILVIKNFSK